MIEQMQKYFQFNLKVLHKYSQNFNTFQKCLIPYEKYPIGLIPGSAVKCTTSSGGQYICRLYALDNNYPKNYCVVDKSVRLFKTNSEEITCFDNEEILLQIEILDKCNESYESICVEVEIDSFNQIQNVSELEKITKNILHSYYMIIPGCKIILKSYLKYGIKSIFVQEVKNNGDVIKYFDDNCLVTIDSVRYLDGKSFKYKKLAGMDSIMQKLNNLINDIKFRHLSNSCEVAHSLNTLLIGPPGSGKTSILQNFIATNKCNIFEINSINIIKQYPGETEAVLRDIFQKVKFFIKKFKPQNLTVLLIENLDLLCPEEKMSNDDGQSSRISSQLISLLDDIHRESLNLLIFGTTSNIESINLAIRRPGRFANEIYLNIPNLEQREKILQLLLESTPFQNSNIDLKQLKVEMAKKTQGFVAADLVSLINKIMEKFIKNSSMLNQFTTNDIIVSFEQILKYLKSSSIRGTEVTVAKSEETFQKIGGMMELKKTLEISILSAFKHPDVFERFGIKPPKGILLYGPPGCAKTMIAKCISNEAHMTLIATSGAEIYSPYVGNAEKFIVKIFNTARKHLPCLIFFDEIDALVGTRAGNSKNEVRSRVLSTLLTEMDGIGIKMQSNISSFDMKSNILVVGATNRPDMIDDALLRPGRFDKLIHVPAPDRNSRIEIINICKTKMPFSDDVRIDNIADKTNGYSGADLCNLCNEAAIEAFTNNPETKEISLKNIETVFNKIKPSLTTKQIDWYYKFESMHSIV